MYVPKRFMMYSAVLGLALGMTTFGIAQSDNAAKSDNTTKAHKSAKSNKADSSNAAGSLSPADQKFVKDAAAGGLAEVELGNLAKDKGQSAEVKQFGERMVNDHSKANDELKSLASQKGVDVPSSLNPKDQKEKERLSNLSGDQFDKAYMNHMVADHKKDVAEFQKESNSGKDPDVKAWAAKTLPTLQDHLKQAQQDQQKVTSQDSKSKNDQSASNK